MKKYLDNINWRKVSKIALVAVPILVWDLFYFLVTQFYEACTFVDEEGGKVLDRFLNKQ